MPSLSMLKGLALLIAIILIAIGVVFLCGPDESSEDKPAQTSPTVVPTAPASVATSTPNGMLDLSGQWTMEVDVTRAEGVCAGEEDDPPYKEVITITQSGNALMVTGIAGASASFQGTFDGNEADFSGTKSDGSGTTTTSFTLVYDPATETMAGTETWSWDGGSGTCPNGGSAVVAERN